MKNTVFSNLNSFNSPRVLTPFKIAFSAVSLCLLGSTVNAQEWNIDQKESSIHFTVQHLMISRVDGNLTKFSGSVEFDGVNLDNATVRASIASDSIDTKNEMRDKHLRKDDVLDVREFPSIKFVSKKITPHSDGSFDIVGDLELHGIVRTVTLNAAPFKCAPVDAAGKRHIFAKAKTVINRKQFGIYVDKAIDKGGIVGDQVKVDLNICLVDKV